MDYNLLSAVLQRFEGSLTYLALGLPDVLEVQNKCRKKRMKKFFKTPNILQMPNLKTISLFGYCPPSLKFICGQDLRSLEYFNFYYRNNTSQGSKRTFCYPVPAAIDAEITDVIHRLASLWNEDLSCCKEIEMLKSNIWTVFPRLKGALIDNHMGPLNQNGWTYRRSNVK